MNESELRLIGLGFSCLGLIVSGSVLIYKFLNRKRIPRLIDELNKVGDNLYEIQQDLYRMESAKAKDITPKPPPTPKQLPPPK